MVRTASGGGEGGGSGGGGGGKFVSVNLNKSYGLPSPPSASSASPSSSSSSASVAVRFSSRLPKQGGMVLLSRPGLRLPPTTSPGPASSKLGAGGGASAAVGTPKLSVPLPVNLPSLRSQHGGNDPSVTLTGVGPAAATAATASLTGWSRQPQEQPLPLVVEGASGSDVVGPGNRQRGDAYAPPGARRTSVAMNLAAPPGGGGPLVLERASVVLKGEDFPTLKAASTPSVALPALPPPQTKQQPKERPAKQKEEASEPAFPPLEPPPPPQVLKKEEPRPSSPPKSLDGSWRKQGPGLPPPPLTRLSRTSDWDDDERETSQTLLRPPKETHHPEDALGSSSSNSNRGGGGGHSTTWSRSSSGYGRDSKDENNSWEPNGFNRGLESSKEFGHPPNRAAPKESGVGHFNRDYIDRTGEHRREGGAVAAHVWDGGFAKESSFNSSRYAAPRREPNGLDKLSSGDWLGKSAERFGSYAPRPSPTERGRKAEFGNDVRRSSFVFDKSRIESPSFQNTDFAASLRGGYGGSSIDPFGLDVKVIRKKREESERRNLRDPERESFEAELERVQSMLEQERRRAAEEQERAVEVARKEQEERERLAREEEELRLKMEEEAREAAAELEREAIEAAAKAERDRKAREEEKHKDVIEEERRKEAARKKLLELEERIAKREVERKREEEERKRQDESASNYDNQQSQDQATWEDKELHQHPFPVTVSRLKQDDDDDQGDERDQLRESFNGNHSRPTSSETMPYPADYRVDQADVLGSQSLSSQRRLRVENEHHSFQAPSVLTLPGQNDFGVNSNNKWRPNRGFPSREAAPNAVPNHSSQESSQWESFVRRGRSSDSNEQRQNAKKDPYNSLLPLSEEDPSPQMLGSSYEREGDCEWDRSNGLNSFSPSPYLRGVDSIDSLSTGRARLALSKQPRVPLPPVIQASPWRPQRRVEKEQQPLASVHTEVSVTKPSGCEVSSPVKVGFEDKEVEKVSEDFGGIEEEEEIWEASEPDSQRVSPELDSDNNEEVIDNPPCDIRTNGGDEVPSADSGELQISRKGERSDGVDYEEDWGVEEGGVDDYDADLGEEEEDEEEEDQEIEGVKDSVKPSHDYEEDRAADVSEGEYEEGNTDDEEEGGNKAENRIGEAPLPHLNEDPGKEMEKSCVSEEVRDEVAALNLGLPLFSDSIGSVEAMGNVGPVRHTSLGQQFQAPFSFMAVPLPQSNSSNAPPSLLPPPPSNPVPNPGLPTQPDIPFQLHFGLLPGAPLLPSAIQIGTIQMPLHLHPPVPQLTAHHLHTSQPPLFQFGQIGHSGPFAQPPPATMFPPSMHIHHPMSQPPPQISHPQPSFNQSDVSMYPSPNEDIRLPSPNENAPAQNQDPMPLEDSSSNSVEPSLALPSNPGEVTADVLVEDPNQEGFQVNDNPPSEQFAGKESRSSRSSGGAQLNNTRRRGSSSSYRGGLAPSGRGGRGGGRFGNANNGFEAWGFENNGRKIGGGTGERFVRNRPPRRSFRRAEFKVKEPYSQNPSDIPGFGRQQQQWEEEHYQQTSSNITPPYSEYRDSQFNQGGRTANRRSSAIDERTYNGGAYHNSRVDQSGGRNGNNAGIMKPTTKAVGMPSNHPSVVRPSVKATNAGLSSNRRYSDTRNHVGREAFSDAPLQSGVVHVFEQPGIEIPNNDDDFIEVRSKRQMLNDKREQREKEIKSRNKEAKLSEHGLRKQQRISKSIQQADTTAPEMNSAQSGEKQLSLQNSDMETANIDVKQPAPTAMPQTRPSTVQPPLAPIGTPALASSDAPEKKAKGPRPVHANPLPGSNQVSTDRPTSEIHAGIRDKAVNPTSAWGGQRPTCQPVSLTQIQLEEVMKPRFEAPLSQQRSSSERPIRAIEPTGIPAAGMISHEKVTATVPGPVASLLAGEKIQFGAVTLPPIILPSTQSHTPSMPPTVGSSLSSDVKSMVGPVENSPFPSRGKRARGNEEKSRDAADVEAEAAASAVAAAVISSDEFIGSACPSDSRSNPLVRMVTPVSGSSFAKPDGCSTDVSGVATTLPSGSLVPAVEDLVALSLPADLSVEGPPLMLRGPLHSGQGSSGLMLPPLSGVVSPFPCLEMGPMLSGPPFFSLAPSEDALSMPQGMKQACTLPGMGPGSVSWQQRHSTGVDSFYSGQPSVFPGPFIGPAGGVPGIQGPAHMLVYTNPFASVGQYGQLGVSFMGTTYIPSGKQPDWKHTPILTSSPESHLSEGEMGGNSLGGMMSQPGNSSVVNPAQQHVGLSGSSVMPVSPPLGLFDLSLSAPFQMPNTETMTEPQWPYVPQSVPISGPVMGHLMQSWNFGGLPNQMPPLSQMMTQGNPPGLRSIPSPKPTPNNNNNTLAADAATRFPDELGLDASSLPSNMASLATVGSRLPMPSKESTAPLPTSTALNNNKIPRHRRPLRGTRGTDLADNANNPSLDVVGMVSSNGSAPNVGHKAMGGGGYDEGRFPSQQGGTARGGVGNEWPSSGNHHRKGMGGGGGRAPSAEKPFALPSKMKQVYVAKAVVPPLPPRVESSQQDTPGNVFSL